MRITGLTLTSQNIFGYYHEFIENLGNGIILNNCYGDIS